MGAFVVVVCECHRAIHSQDIPLSNRPADLTETEWRDLIKGLHHIGHLAKQNNMDIVYHHHMGTVIQTQEQINRLMAETDKALVSLLLDTGHLECAGGDINLFIQDHGPRIKHVHFKDLRKDAFADSTQRDLSFLSSVCEGVFTVPGDGCLNFPKISSLLADRHYQGWIIVEAEQDPDKVPPLEYAKMGRQYIQEKIGV